MNVNVHARTWMVFPNGTRICIEEVVAYEPNASRDVPSTMVHMSSGRAIYVDLTTDDFQSEMDRILAETQAKVGVA